MRELRILLQAIVCVALLSGATLERLSMDDLSIKSTDIVRARVSGVRTAVRGSIIYTYYSVQVIERLKGAQSDSMEVAVPGGVTGGLRQTFSGAPNLSTGNEYLLFLWRGPSGITQVTGLSQGVFDVKAEAGGQKTALRSATAGLMLDAGTHKVVQDAPMRLDLTDLRTRISSALGRGAAR